LDEDPTWEKLARQAVRGESPQSLSEDQRTSLAQVPVLVQIEATSGLELTKFLVALKTAVESAAPGMLQWDLRQHEGQSYAKVSASELAKDRRQTSRPLPVQLLDSASIYYAAFGDALVLSLNERVLQHALERRVERRARVDESASSVAGRWAGDHLSVYVDAKLLRLLSELGEPESYQRFMQKRSWSNLPVLNEWKRLDPAADPVALYEQLWSMRPVCPGGGKYVWNEKDGTMESTVYGHPAAPKSGPSLPDALRRFSGAELGLTFESTGLQARLSLKLNDSESR
jgi:hypothetical protein